MTHDQWPRFHPAQQPHHHAGGPYPPAPPPGHLPPGQPMGPQPAPRPSKGGFPLRIPSALIGAVGVLAVLGLFLWALERVDAVGGVLADRTLMFMAAAMGLLALVAIVKAASRRR